MSGPQVERRLAAIVSADVAGYSRLMQADEEGTHAALKAHRADVVDPAIDAIGGRLVKTTGDGVLLEFPSVNAAVQCAVAVQQEMQYRNADLPEQRRMLFRIGINAGNVIVDDGELFGDEVNVAVRLQELAEPGGACISDGVRREVEDKLGAVFDDAGAHKLKNMRRPLRIWRWHGAADTAQIGPEVSEVPRLPGRPSIAVLAFDNLSGDADQEYFADGITEDIITALCRFRWFFVISRDSSFSYKGTETAVKQIARELGVRYVLQGSVRKAGSRIRIGAKLIDASTGGYVWAERYERQLADMFELQDEMTETIVAAIEPELSSAERARAKLKPPDSLDAWDLFQRGQWHYAQWTREDARQAEELLRAAIERDAGFAPAHSMLALVHLVYVLFGWTDSPGDAMGEAFRFAQQAVALDDRDPMAHFALGRAFTLKGELETAIAELERSLELNPNHARGYLGLGLALQWFGRARDAQPYYRRALRQSPHDPMRWTFEGAIGSAYFHIGAFDEAIRWVKRATRRPNCGFHAHVNLAASLAEAGRLDEARQSLDVAADMQPGLSISAVSAMLRTMHDDYREQYLSALRKAGLAE